MLIGTQDVESIKQWGLFYDTRRRVCFNNDCCLDVSATEESCRVVFFAFSACDNVRSYALSVENNVRQTPVTVLRWLRISVVESKHQKQKWICTRNSNHNKKPHKAYHQGVGYEVQLHLANSNVVRPFPLACTVCLFLGETFAGLCIDVLLPLFLEAPSPHKK